MEIPIFWETLPDDAIRHAIAAALNADFLYTYDGPPREDQLLINGVQVNLWHISVRHEEEIIKADLDAQNLDLGSLNALDTIRSCIPLYGHEIVQTWKLWAQDYPNKLIESKETLVNKIAMPPAQTLRGFLSEFSI